MNVRVVGFFLVLAVAVASWFLTCAAWQVDQVTAGVVPLDPREFESLTLVAVGTGGPWENPKRSGPCLAVALGDEIALVDAGRGSAAGLRGARIPVSQPRAVYLTSLMPENTLGLPDLLLTGWLDGRQAPLELLGPPGTRELAARIEAAFAPAIRAQTEALGLPPDGARFAVQEIAAGDQPARGGIHVRSAELPGGPLATLAYRFEAGGKALVTAPVGWGREELIAFATGAALLVRDAAFVPTPENAREIGLDLDPDLLRRQRALFTPLDEVGGVAQRAGVHTLVLVRMRPPPVYDLQVTALVDDRFDGRIVIPDDGDEIRP